jgi:branched-chain amino acid transport system permease protein
MPLSDSTQISGSAAPVRIGEPAPGQTASERPRGATASRVDLVLGLTAAAALGITPFLGATDFQLSLLIEAMTFAILAMSLNLLLGYAGLVSFGHAAFFAVGAYASGVAANNISTEIWISLPVGIAAAALLAIPVGWLSIRLSGFYFLMITFAFAQMIYAVVYRWNWLTGGSDGLLINAPTLIGTPALQSRHAIYFFSLACFGISFLLMHRIITSPFGYVLVGIRENTRRMRALGYDVRHYKLLAFVIAAAFGGLSGVVIAQLNLFIGPESAHWTESGLVLVMVLIGGTGSMIGSTIGAAIVLLLQHWLSSYTEYWSLALGVLFICLIMWAREGVYGLAARGLALFRERASK